MTGSDSITCPNCGKEADFNWTTNNLPTDSLECLHCGLTISPKVEFVTDLTVLNERRADFDLPPLTKLPKQEFEL